MNVVDSSAWLEYFANGSNASFFSGPIEAIDELVVPSLTIYEVFNRVLQQWDESHALAPSPSCNKAPSSISTAGSPCPRHA